jgi:hypothetical protein
MAKHKDKMKGGLADKKQPKDFDQKALKQGMRVELEHTSDRSIAKEIAMDHLSEDPDYYSKLSEIEKQDKLKVVSADGKSDIVEGKELLEKDPAKKWSKVRKALNNLEAIMNIKEESQLEQPDETQQQQPEPEAADMPQETEQDMQQPPTEAAAEPVDEEKELSDLIESLKHHGYSDAEIAHIVHDHHFPEMSDKDSADIGMSREAHDMEMDAKQKESSHDLEHKKRMSDLEYENAKASAEDPHMDKQHKKRMLELEYEIAREQKILELEFKKKELELKLKHIEESNKKKLQDTAHKQVKED